LRKKICNHPGCQNLIDINERYCKEHIKPSKKPFEGAIRYNEELYKTIQWKQLRKKLLREQPNCFYCGVSKEEIPLEVHHRIPPRGNEELFFDYNNLVVVCGGCHKTITAKEIRERKYENKSRKNYYPFYRKRYVPS
jgi:5-methylcytosine-specific restriction endonuclease McrA